VAAAVAYDFRMDLRVVYQHVCRNHPRPDEPQYPLWHGPAPDSELTRAELAARVDECTGVRKPAAQRTRAAKGREPGHDREDRMRIEERSLIGHLNWATWLFRDLTQLRLDGRNPFGNVGAMYQGSADDAALNARGGALCGRSTGVAAAGQATAARTGRLAGAGAEHCMPIHDPTAFVELESLYRETAGSRRPARAAGADFQR
jgi:hypothetical protein